MKKLLLTTLLFVVASLVMQASLRHQTFSLTFSEDDFELLEENGILHILPDPELFANYPEENRPALPLIPADCSVSGIVAHVKTTPTFTKRLIRSNVVLAQAPVPVPSSSVIQQTRVEEPAYAHNIYPESNCEYITSSDLDDKTKLYFLSCPFVYDAAQKELYFIDSMNVDLLVDSVDPEPAGSSKTEAAKATSTNEKIDYVIITNNALKPSFERLAQWKKTKGLYSKIVTIEEIKSKYGQATPHYIKQYLKDLYTSNKLTYALLGGDDSVVPAIKCKIMVKTPEDEEDIPTDLYYACFNGDFDWNANKNSIIGEVNDKVDLTPQIYVTRVPVREPEQVKAFIDKQLAYERSPKWGNKILMSGAELHWNKVIDGETVSDAQIKGQILIDHSIKPIWKGNIIRCYDTYTDLFDSHGYPILGEPYAIKAQLSLGYDFLNMESHGAPAYWRLINYSQYTCQMATEQENTGHTHIVTSACKTNMFDDPEGPCLSESFIRNPSSGVISYLGSSRSGWGYSTDAKTPRLGPSQQYESSFFINLLKNPQNDKNYGKIVAQAKKEMISKCNDNAFRSVMFGLNPIGDPETPIFVETPKKLDTGISYRNAGKITLDAKPKGTRICIMSASDYGQSFYKVVCDNKATSYTFPDFPVGITCNLCFTKQGYIPINLTLCLLQNETLTGTNVYTSKDCMSAGPNLTSSRPSGPVVIQSGTTTINADMIKLWSDVTVAKNATLILNNNF
ncbi:MAG: hypothetical protein K2H33_07085 [Muribaculaceae bacterium]|nr:hypothetical protein [Muribaculaceae bacterium]